MHKKIKIFNRLNVPCNTSYELYIRVNAKTGIIAFSRGLCEKISLKGKGVNFIQDEERKEDWYFSLTSDKNAFPLKSKKARSSSKTETFMIQNLWMVREIIKSIPVAHKSFKMTVSSEPDADGYYVIITKSATETKKGQDE